MAVTETERYDRFEDYLGGKIDIFGEGFTMGGEGERNSWTLDCKSKCMLILFVKTCNKGLGFYGRRAALKNTMRWFSDTLNFKPLSHPRIAFYQRQVSS